MKNKITFHTPVFAKNNEGRVMQLMGMNPDTNVWTVRDVIKAVEFDGHAGVHFNFNKVSFTFSGPFGSNSEVYGYIIETLAKDIHEVPFEEIIGYTEIPTGKTLVLV